MSGLGAWHYGYYREGMQAADERSAAGIKAFKQALVDNGYGDGINVALPRFGMAADTQTRKFQANHGLAVDGVIGPNTARALFRYYAYAEEHAGTVQIPNHLALKIGGHESGHDPVAQGYADPQDEGWAQLHLPYFTGLTIEQAWTPSIAVHKLCSHLKKFYVNVEADWDGSVASWNVGDGTAQSWVMAGKPADDPSAEGGIDWYARATAYVAAVKTQSS